MSVMEDGIFMLIMYQEQVTFDNVEILKLKFLILNAHVLEIYVELMLIQSMH